MLIFINKLDATPPPPHPYLYHWKFLTCANLEIVLFAFHCSVVSQQSVLLRVDKAIPFISFVSCRMRFLILDWSVGKRKKKTRK